MFDPELRAFVLTYMNACSYGVIVDRVRVRNPLDLRVNNQNHGEPGDEQLNTSAKYFFQNRLGRRQSRLIFNTVFAFELVKLKDIFFVDVNSNGAWPDKTAC